MTQWNDARGHFHDQVQEVMMRILRIGLFAAAAATALAACADAAGPPANPVSIVGTAAAALSNGVSPNSTDLQITGLRIGIGNVGLGNGDQFGCIDCQGGTEGGEENPAAVTLVAIPVGEGAVQLKTEMASPGMYSQIEIEIGPASGSLDPTFPTGKSIEITGFYNGAAFTLAYAISGSSIHTLDAPVNVTSQQQETAVATLRFPVDSWFTGPGGPLDPASAADTILIEANIKAYFADTER
jgi:hypothetical protein